MIFGTKKSNEIYDIIIAHRGYQKGTVENSIKSFKNAIELNLAIETDIRITKDHVLVCFHDRHLKRLLGIRGKICKYNYNDINDYYIKESKEKIPTLQELLSLVDGKVIILLEIKGNINKNMKVQLCKILNTYNGKVYFHAKNIFTYFYIRRIFGNNVFFVLNPLRKRFNFIK